MLAAVSACSLTDALSPGSDKTKGKARPPNTDPPPPVPLVPAPEPLAAAKLARRIATDLSLRLPSPTDVETIVADTDRTTVVVDTYIEGAASSTAIAQLHPRMWRLSERRINGLDQYVDGGDTALAASLTEAMRRQIVEEPVQFLRYNLDRRQPYPTLFTSSYTILRGDVAAFWDMTTESAPWTGEPYRFSLYADDRPAAGLLVSNALVSGHSTSQNGDAGRATSLLERLTCTPFANIDAHLFYDLTADELAGDLSALALVRPACVGCHSQINGLKSGLAGLGTGDDFAAFRTYVAPAAAPESYFGGLPFAGLAELGSRVGEDPRVHRCEIERLIAALYQRPFSDRDRKTAALAMDEFYANAMDLKAATRRIVLDPEFGIAPLTSSIKGKALYTASGVRILGRAGWQGLVEELVPGATTIEYPPELDPGSEEQLTGDWMVPAGSYWLAVDRVARQAATAIIRAELADDSLAVNRRLLKELPDGAGSSAEILLVYTQIRKAWQRLTGEELSESSQVYFDLQALWAAVDPGTNAESFRQAWRTVLVGMLAHPQVVTY